MAAVKRAALGKGLGALLAEADKIQGTAEIRSVIASGPAAVNEIPLEKIVPNPFQPRMNFDKEALEELTDSVRTLGIIQPLTLRQLSNNEYQIISGERRFRAAQAAGLKTVPAYIRKADDGAMLEMAIVENIQRQDLDAIETALSFQRLINECNLTQEGMAQRVGKPRATVANYLRLLNLPEEIQKAIKVGKVSVGHAKVLLGVNDIEKQLTLCESLIKDDWSVRQLEQKIKESLGVAPEEKKSTETPSPSEKFQPAEELPAIYKALASRVGSHFANKISIKRKADGTGSITIRFDKDSQVESFLSALADKE